MKWSVVFGLGLALGAMAPAIAFTATAPAAGSEGAAGDGILAAGVRQVTLPNGLTVLLAPDSLATAVDVAVWYPAGTRAEPPGKSGLTQLVERAMFHGTRKVPGTGFQQRLLAEGSAPGSLSHPDYALFFETVAPAALETALELEADRMASLAIGAAQFETERRAAVQDRRTRLDRRAIGRGYEKLFATAFAGHPYARPAIGVAADLERLTPADAATFLRNYGPRGALLTVTGRIDPEPALALVRRHFGAIAARPAAPARAASPLRAQTAERRVIDTHTGSSSLLFMGWRGGPERDPANPALELLGVLLGDGQPSRLQGALVAAGPRVAEVQADFDRRRDASLLFCVVALKPGQDSTGVEQALRGAVEALAHAPLSDDDLERGKRRIEARMLADLETTRGRGQAIGNARMLEGDAAAWDRRLARVRALTAAEVQSAAAAVLKPATRSTVWLLARGAAEGGAK